MYNLMNFTEFYLKGTVYIFYRLIDTFFSIFYEKNIEIPWVQKYKFLQKHSQSNDN